MTKSRGQLISKLQHMKFQPNGNSIQHFNYEDINTICNYLLEDKKEIEKLEKALDRACEMLTKLTSDCNVYQCPFNCECDCGFECENKDYWKEWCMKDDE